MSRTYAEVAADEVRWYSRNGLYADRIRRDSHGIAYVIGDWSWNRSEPNRYEVIEGRMAHELEGAARDRTD